MEQADAAVIAAAQIGDRDAQSRLYQQHVRLLFGYLYNKLGSQQVAEDICQETFLRAFKSLRTYNGTASFKNWLFQIAKHLIADHWTAHYKQTVISFEEYFEATEPAYLPADETPDTNLKAEAQVQRILEQLSPEYRQVLEYRFLRGYSLQETADAAGISLANTKVRQYRALLKAKQLSTTV